MANIYNANITLSQSNNWILQGSQCNDFLIFTGNSNQKIIFGCSNTSNIIAIFNSNGYLGIGKSNPLYAIDIIGDLNFSGTLRQAGSAYIGSQWSNNSSNVFIIGSNIGIGKSNPSYPLDVNGDINFTGIFRQNGTPYVGSQWSNNSSNVFLLGSNIGIGNSNPQAQLHVTSNLRVDGNLAFNNGITFTSIEILPGTGNFNNVSQIIASTSNIQGYSNAIYGSSGSNGTIFSIMSNTSNDSFRFLSGSSSNEIMRLTGNGWLAIGNSNPQAQLHVTSNIRVDGSINTTAYINRIWDYSGSISSYGGLKPGPISENYRIGSNIVVSTFTPFSNINTEGSIYLPGITSNYILISQPMSIPLTDTTIETWIYLSSNSTSNYINTTNPNLIGNMSPTSSNNYWSFGITSNNILTFYSVTNNVGCYAYASNIVNNTWNHIAICYSNIGKSGQLFLNGNIQTLTVTGTGTSGNSTTTITFPAGISNNSNFPILIGQLNNIALNAYIADFRIVNTVLYTNSFIPPVYPLQTYSNTTSLLLKAPLYNPIINTNNIQTYDSLRTHCLPTDALIYADCYGINLPNLAASNTPLFDSNITQSIVFNRTFNNYLSFSPQTFNIASKGITIITKLMLTSNIETYERIFEFGNVTGFGNNNILLSRNSTSNLSFYIYNSGVNISISPSFSFNQNIIYTIICRYDPYNNNDQINYFGNMALYLNGSNISNSNIGSSIGNDRIMNYIFLGNSYSSSNYYLNANIYNFAVYNRALTDKEITDASSILNVNPTLPNNSTMEIGNSIGKPSLILKNDGSIQVAGPISAMNNQNYYPIDYSSCNFNLAGFTYGSVPGQTISPFNSVGINEGSVYLNSNGYINIQSTVFETSWWLNGGFTLEAWINYLNFSNVFVGGCATTLGIMTGRVNYFNFGPNQSTNLCLYVAGVGSFNGSNIMNSNTWYHIAVSYDLSNLRLFQNGIVQLSSNLTTTPSTIGLPYFGIGGPYVGSNVNSAYITNVRLVYGAALYTSNFSPSTTPLTVSSIGNTALLLRVPQNPGKILIPKIGGTTQVQAYPPAAMTGNLTNIQNTSYGAGYYITTSSTQNASNHNAWNAFDKSQTDWWLPTTGTYTNGIYSGTQTTVDIYGNVYLGDWLQIQLPVSILLSSYSLTTGTSGYILNQWYIFGSINGRSWVLLNQNSVTLTATPTNFNVSTNNAYPYYRIVTYSCVNSSPIAPIIVEWILYGIEESMNIAADGQIGFGLSQPTQQLEVAGNAMIYGNISANNMGIFRNRIINGDMRVNQRGITSSNMSGNGYSTIDKFSFGPNGGSGGIMTVTQNTLTISDTPYQYGFVNSSRITISTAITSFYAGTTLAQGIESYNITDFNWGTCYALPITISFWFRATINGSYPIIINNNGQPSWWGYTTLYLYNIAPAWQFITITIPPPPWYSSWNTNSTSIGLFIYIGNYATQYAQTTNTWLSTVVLGTNGSINWVTTVGNYIEVTGLQLEKGTIATPFEFRPYSIEWQLCQRYLVAYTQSYAYIGIGFAASSPEGVIKLSTPMRTSPYISSYSNLTIDISGVEGLSLTNVQIESGNKSSADTVVITGSGTFSANSTNQYVGGLSIGQYGFLYLLADF